ncbi:MAG: type I-C CRISPR-associated protein Cas7/Csd2 [Anaerolineales bacterium]|nr:type I-C CRISPR-associated protein Cas7/Csd2 [Anaerolineales bacterium]MCL4261538.1 type I-C CRISPR-associated protein Cas7/Csd2 [Anaerolineales bacterium]
MSTLKNKIDFAVIVSVNHANPNGDPLNGNRPRVNFDGFGELSDVSIKRKIRNRIMTMDGYTDSIFVQSDDNRNDDYRSLRQRAEGVLKNVDMKNDKKYREAACKQWFDVRAFGQVFAYKAGKKGKKDDDAEGGDDKGVSIGIRGPVSIHPAFSVATVQDRISSTQITKSVSGEGDGTKRGSDTMGMKHRVEHGVYVFYGSMNTQLADKTGFSDKDAEAIKEAIRTLFRNDASSARPEGSMSVFRVYWWGHNNPTGQHSSAKVHNAVRSKVGLGEGVTEPKDMGDYVYPSKEDVEKELPGLKCEVFEGE